MNHVVRMLVIGAGHSAPTINGRLHRLSDAELIGSGIPYTIVKPHFFMQNLLMATQSIAQDGVMYLPLAESQMGIIDTRDISRFAAQVLTTTGHDGKTYTISGPTSVTMHQAVDAIGAAIGKQVRYESITIEAIWQSMV